MLVRDVMTKNLELVLPDSSLQTAARKMKELDIGVLPVGTHRHVEGLLTDRDITVRAVAEGVDPKVATVQEIMTHKVICCQEDESIDEAAHRMEAHQIRRLLVQNRDHDPVGIISFADIARVTHDRQLEGELLERISEPAIY